MPKKNGNLITILSTSNQAIVSVAKTLLEEAGINYYIVEEDGKNSRNNGNGESKNNKETELQVELSKSLEARSVIADLVELDFDEQNI